MIRNITLKRRKNRIEYEIRICIRTPIEAVSQNYICYTQHAEAGSEYKVRSQRN
jgi:hypothetical protein